MIALEVKYIVLKPVLEVLSFHILSVWVKHQIANINRTVPSAKIYVVFAEFPMGLKFHFFQWKTYFSQFVDKFVNLRR